MCHVYRVRRFLGSLLDEDKDPDATRDLTTIAAVMDTYERHGDLDARLVEVGYDRESLRRMVWMVAMMASSDQLVPGCLDMLSESIQEALGDDV